MRLALDSNILVHAFNSAEPKRHANASDIMERAVSADCVIPAQTVGEFLAVIRRTLPTEGDRAARFADQILAAVPVATTTGADIAAAAHIAARYRLQFWDSVIIAVARANHAGVLLTEDMQDGQMIEGVQLINPFNPANRALVDALLIPF